MSTCVDAGHFASPCGRRSPEIAGRRGRHRILGRLLDRIRDRLQRLLAPSVARRCGRQPAKKQIPPDSLPAGRPPEPRATCRAFRYLQQGLHSRQALGDRSRWRAARTAWRRRIAAPPPYRCPLRVGMVAETGSSIAARAAYSIASGVLPDADLSRERPICAVALLGSD